MTPQAAPPRDETAQRAGGALEASLRRVLGPDGLSADEVERDYLAYDISGRGAQAPALIARPHSVVEACEVVRLTVEAGRAIVPRGGGMSYTGGYHVTGEGAVLLDLRGLDRVEEIAETDGYVVVEAGCSWAVLHEALAARRLRTPFFGPLSGIAATIGGALSQNAAFFGSAQHGVSADSVLGLEIILANGTLLRTGSWASEGRRPFQRAYGPDLTGLFLGDCGALGVKARVALKIQPMPHSAYASFALPDGPALVGAQQALAGLGGLAECFGFDPVANDNLRRGGFTLREKAEALRDVAQATGGLRGVLAAVGLGARRTAFLDEVRFSLHLVADGASQVEADATLTKARAILAAHPGREIADSIPRATRAKPFRPIKALLGPDGELWLPVHGIVPLSQAQAVLSAVEGVLLAAKAEIDRQGVRVSLLTVLVGRAFLIEPQFFWRDALSPFHQRHVTPAQREAHGAQAAAPAARALVHDLREKLAGALDALGGAHFQIGKYYDYEGGLLPASAAALSDLKALLDPTFCMNPGALGLSRGGDTRLQRRS
jgi:FAD/FMN-containing dehydrogenase